MSDSHLYGEDLVFADQLLERLYEFTKREVTHPEDAMVLECVDGRHRYIVHQAVQLFPSLASFSVGDGKMRRPVVCFAAKLPRSIQSPQMDRQRRKLYQPPTRRDNHNAADEKLQDQLMSRMRYIYTSSDDEIDSIEDVDRVPNLNPHAASFIPFSIQTPTVHQDLAPTNYGYNENLYPTTALNPTVPDFTPRCASGPQTSPPAQQPGSDRQNLSVFLKTYQEFVPASDSHKRQLPSERLPDMSNKPKKDSPVKRTKERTKPASAYVPPPLRNKEKRQLTEDEMDRLKNQERKERVMVERQERLNEELNTPSQLRPGYAAFKKEKKKKQYNEPRSRDSFTRANDNQSSKIELRRNSHSSETEQSDEQDEEYKMPLCWADDEPLDQTVIDDITKAVPGLKLKRSYDFAIPSHMLEIYDFPKSVRTGDLLNAFQEDYQGFSVRWVDDTHAIAIFASTTQSKECAERGGCGSFRVRSLTDSSDAARKKAAVVAREQRFDIDLEPAERPKTSAVVARRLIAANVDGKIARQIRAAEEEEKLIKGESTIIDGRKSRTKSESKI